MSGELLANWLSLGVSGSCSFFHVLLPPASSPFSRKEAGEKRRARTICPNSGVGNFFSRMHIMRTNLCFTSCFTYYFTPSFRFFEYLISKILLRAFTYTNCGIIELNNAKSSAHGRANIKINVEAFNITHSLRSLLPFRLLRFIFYLLSFSTLTRWLRSPLPLRLLRALCVKGTSWVSEEKKE